MHTVTIELKHSSALRLLKDLELADIIRVLDKDRNDKHVKLSKSLRGAISKERANELNDQLNKMRQQWEERNI